MKKQVKERDRHASASANVSSDPQFAEVRNLLTKLKERYNLSTVDIARALDAKEILFPISAFTSELSALETIVKFLRENIRISFREAASVLQRSEKTVWQSYAAATKKYPKPLVVAETGCYIPLSLVQTRKLSVLETIVVFLKETYELSYHEIAVLLHRNDRTVWTVYQRGKAKQAKGENHGKH